MNQFTPDSQNNYFFKGCLTFFLGTIAYGFIHYVNVTTNYSNYGLNNLESVSFLILLISTSAYFILGVLEYNKKIDAK